MNSWYLSPVLQHRHLLLHSLKILKVKLILNEVFPDENLDVPDPYHGGDFGFKNVYKMLDEACDVIAKNLNPDV